MDYKAIIEGLNDKAVISLMERLGVDRYEDKGTHLIFPTICHNVDSSEASMKLYFYKDTKLFVCYTSCGTMSIFKFLKHYYEERQIDYDWYDDIYKVIIDCSNFREDAFKIQKYRGIKEIITPRKKIELPIYSNSVLGCFVKAYPAEWLDDGITKETMDKFGILYSISQNKIIIPHYDANNNLVGIRGRALNEWEVENIGKYMPIQIEQTWYKHPLSMNLYGLNFTKENIKETGVCYLFESEKSVLQMEKFDMPNCGVAVCGSNFNKYQLNILMRECAPKEIIICFDKEEQGNEDKYFNKLYNIGKKYSNYCKFSFIYDREGLISLKDSPTDKGEEIFKTLLNKRVEVH